MAILNTNQMFFTPFEPKLQNRFVMYIDGIPSFMVKKVGRPNVSFNDVTLEITAGAVGNTELANYPIKLLK